jgi:hypothetical protein
VKFIWTSAFAGDWRRLSPADQARFRAIIRDDLHPALERRRQDPTSSWPRGLRIRRVEAAPGIWELTWSFAGPDGRATFEWVTIGGEPGIRWRRIGGHAIFGDP